ncbi:MAG: transketolase family protein [Calditrichaeota bacterium]|nr:transketolase family protein [Calditrichota bacterium]
METYGNESLREAFGQALIDAGRRWDDLVVLDAGTKNSTYSQKFQEVFPDRFYTPGINEPGMIGAATGMAMAGKRVAACDMSVFLHHAYAQIRAAARQGSDVHIVIAASHTGVAVGPDGGSAHDLTDLARMRLVSGFNVITPWDGRQIRSVVQVILEEKGLYYVRLNRPKVPIFLPDPAPFEIGKAYKLSEGERITIIAVGDKVYNALIASEELGEGFADVIGISTLEPLDSDTIIASAKKTGRVITVEDHLYIGGLYEAVAGVLAQHHPTPMRRIALDRIFTTSGEPDELAEIYGVNTAAIVRLCKEFAG